MVERKNLYGILVMVLAIAAIILLLPDGHAPEEPFIVMKGNRILGIDITAASDGDYDAAFTLSRSIGMQEVGLYFNWNDIEKTPFNYENPYFAIANTYYPAHGTLVSLTITPIHTNRLVVPEDLQDTPFDDPVMIDRFTLMLDWVFSQIPNLHFHSVVIGSELDVCLGTDKTQWEEYVTFYRDVKTHIKKRYPDVKVAVEATFEGLTGNAKEYLKVLNEYSDVIGVSYYPLNPDFTVKDPSVVKFDFDVLTTLYPGRRIFFYQLGYPSSPVLKSSQEKQEQFILEVFKAWDEHAFQIQLIDFTWLHDISPEGVKWCTEFYGLSDAEFQEFLATLGLRTYQGKDKKAWKVLQEEAQKRGW